MKETEKVFDPVTGEEVVKTEEEPKTSEVEETTPPKETEEGKETPPPSEGVKPEVDEFGVPYKNRAKEYERKLREVEARLQEKARELEERGKQEEADELENVLKEIEDSDEPTTPAQFRKITNAIGNRVTKSVARIIGPMMASQRVVEAQINRLKGQDGFEPKAESLLRSNLNEVSPEALVGNPEVISNKIYDMTLGQLTREGKLGGKPTQPKKTPAPGAPKIETPGISPAKGKKPPSEAEKKEAEDKHVSVEALRGIKARREKGKKDREKK